MALLIKDTPVLRGKDAERFLAEIEASKDDRPSPEERVRMKKNFDFIMRAAEKNNTF